MKIQQKLISQVKSFLFNQHNITISLPTLHNLLDSKLNLKVSPASITPAIIRENAPHLRLPENMPRYLNMESEDVANNRYRLIIMFVEEILFSSSLDMTNIEQFMLIFNRTINTDIQIMQRNQTIRSNSFKMKQKLVFKIDEISRKTQTLTSTSEKIHDKSDIISFIAIDIKNYLLSMKLVEDEYEAVRTVEIHTPIKIDKIYKFQYSSEEDYHDHYEPLLEVLVRLRANMNNLSESVKKCDRIDMPLKSVNLLATCKNLLTQLEPFLITNQCSFNRLIFHVVTQQSQNMKLISSFYKQYLQFIKSLVYNAFKCVYLGHLFKPNYYQLNEKIGKEKDNVMQLVLRINMNIKHEKYSQTEKRIKSLQLSLEEITKKIISMKRIICFGKSTIMQNYLQQKICKKLNLLLLKRQQVRQLFQQLNNAKIYLSNMRSLIKQIDQLPKFRQLIQKHAQIIGKDVPKNGIQNIIQMQSNPNAPAQQKREKIFKNDFIKIQEKYLTVSRIDKNIQAQQKLCKFQKIKEQYFPQLTQITKSYKQELSELEIKLLKSYQQFLQINQQKQAQAQKQCKRTMKQVSNYLTNQDQQQTGAAVSAMGGDILNEDQHSNRVKLLLEKVDKAEYLTKNSVKKVGREDEKSSDQVLRKLEMQRKFLEWLLTMFEGSMDQNILQSIIDKMDFTEDNQNNICKNVGKVNQLIIEVQKHNKQVVKIVKQIQFRNTTVQQQRQKEKEKQKQKQKNMLMSSAPKKSTPTMMKEQQQHQNQIYNKLYKISRERLILYQMIENIYAECLSVYNSFKLNSNKVAKKQYLTIKEDGVKLFDKKLFQYVLMSYHCLNKVGVLAKELNDSNIKTKTKNYINDDILEPFTNRLINYVKFNEKQLLNLVLKLQKAIDIEKNYKSRLKKWQQICQKTYTKQKNKQNFSLHIQNLRQKSEQLLRMQKQIQGIKQMNENEVKVINIQQINKIYQQCEEHYTFAKQLLQAQAQDLHDQVSRWKFKNQNLNKIKILIQKFVSDK